MKKIILIVALIVIVIKEVYELKDSASTSFFMNLASETLSMSIMAYGNSSSKILKKAGHKSTEQSNIVLIPGQH